MHTLKERALHPLRRTGFEHLQALRDVSFNVAHGEFFGIVGRNGSGKSTLLKCMAGIYAVDTGTIYVNGRVSTFIELGVGFNPDLAARDNVVLNAIMMGLSPREAKERFEEVIRFAELEEFVELKLKNYSSGMHVRLAFSVMIQVDAEILLIDEVLAVGDAAFQQKCFDQFNRMRDEERTIVLVTHDMASVNRFCHRALLLERGEMVMLDSPRDVSSEYVDLNFREQDTQATGDSDSEGTKIAEVADAWFEDEDGRRTERLTQGRPCAIVVLTKFHGEIENPIISVAFENDRQQILFATSTMWSGEETGAFGDGDELHVRVSFENPFTLGRYYATPWVAARDAAISWIDRRDRLASVLVTGTFSSGGQVDLPHEVRLDRVLTSRESPASA
jgi:ABC-type polysaccharide/polyol phosphate transport system ATPase subunit